MPESFAKIGIPAGAPLEAPDGMVCLSPAITPTPVSGSLSRSGGAMREGPSRYHILGQLGVGGMGIVYKARDLETGETVALKFLKPEIASDPAVQANFKNELCLSRKITHRNVCRIYEFNRSGSALYITMEFVDGETLFGLLHRGPLPPSKAVAIARQLCAGLHEAHLQNIVHRDLKPANVMVDKQGAAKIMDFGIARLGYGSAPVTGGLFGTPAYMAPEQAEMKAVDARTDVYAVGLLLYEMVTGQPAFAGDSPIAIALKQVREMPQRPRELAPIAPPGLEQIIWKCLQKKPEDRFPSVQEIDYALQTNAFRGSASGLSELLGAGYGWAEWTCKELPRLLKGSRDAASLAAIGGRVRLRPALALVGALLLGGFAAYLMSDSRSPSDSGVQIVGSWQTENRGTAGSDLKGQQGQKSVDPSSVLSNAVSPRIGAQTTSFNMAPSIHSNPHGQIPLEIGTGSRTLFAGDHEVSGPAPRNLGLNRIAAPKTSPAKFTGGLQSSSARFASHHSFSPQPSETRVVSPADTPVPVFPVLAAHLSSFVSPDAKLESNGGAPANAGAPSGLYLEVAGFRKKPDAESTIAKLEQLGYRAGMVRHGHLWLHSYKVEVGPYSNQSELDIAVQQLAAQGFKPHLSN